MDNTVSLIFKGVDQLSGPVKSIDNNLKSLEGRVGSIQQRLGAFGATVFGFFARLGQAAFNGLLRGIDMLVRAIPNLIDRGKEWLTTVDQIADVTGLGAEAASKLAAQAQILEVPIDNLGVLFARFTQNIRPQEKLLNSLGVSIKDAAGNTRDAASIFYDLQRAVATSNNGVDRAAVLAKLFGRNWREASDLLTATPQTLDAIAAHAQAAGLVVSDQALQIRQDFVRTQTALQQSVSGLGTNIFVAVGPALTALVNSIRVAIETNMNQIASFVSRVVGFVVGAISGLFGLNLQLSNFAAGAPVSTQGANDLGNALDKMGSKASSADPRIAGLQSRIKGLDAQLKGIDRREATRSYQEQRQQLLDEIQAAKRGSDAGDAYTRSIKRQISAIDDQIAAMDKRASAQDEERQRQELVDQIGTLQSQLEDMKSQAVFTAGMSALEAELARQQHAAQIADQERQIADAKQQLADHDQQVADDRRRQDLEAQRNALDEKERLHEQEIQDQSRVNDALQQLRDLDHSRQVDLQRQSIEDQKAALQAQIEAIQKAQKPAGTAASGLGTAIRDQLTGANNPFAGLSTQFSTEMQSALSQGKSFATQIHDFLFGKDSGGQNRRVPNPDGKGSSVITIGGTHTAGLFEKIDGLIGELKSFWDTTLKPIWDAMNQLTQPLKDLLGPQGFATLFVLWKFGIPQMLSGFLTNLGALLLRNLFPGRGPSAPDGPGKFTPSNPTSPNEPPLGPRGTNPLGLLAAEFAIPAAILVGTAIPFIPQFTNPGATHPGRTVANNPAAQNFYNPNSPILPDGSPNPAYRGNLPGRDTDRQSFYTPNISPYTGFNLGQGQSPSGVSPTDKYLASIDRALNPGGQFYQQHYDQTDAATRTADDTTRGADATEQTRDAAKGTQTSSADSAASAKSLFQQIQSGINTSVVNNPIIDRIQSKLGIDPSTTVGINNRPSVDVGRPNVDVGNPSVKISNPVDLDSGAKVGLSGVSTPNGALSIVTSSGNTIDLPGNVQKNIANTTNNTNLLSNLKAKNGALNTITKSGSGGSTYGGCFPYETLVATPSGQRPIGELAAGDVIYAVDMGSARRVETTVLMPIPHLEHRESRLLVTLANGTQIETTVSHRFYDPRLDLFHPIGEFVVGDVVLDYSSGRSVEVRIAAIDELGNEAKDVYNIEVAVHHNYIVAGVLVHNPKANAQGLLGLTNGETEIGYAGEAGREAVAIIRNPVPLGRGLFGSSSGAARSISQAGLSSAGVTDRGTFVIQVPLNGDVIGQTAIDFIVRNGQLSTSLHGNF